MSREVFLCQILNVLRFTVSVGPIEPGKILVCLQQFLKANALEKVQLGSLCKTMEHGLDTLIGERGITLSGGERQRVALARLWFEHKEITILDEATSALDNLTEKAVMDAILSLLKERTVIAVAHKLDSIAGFDRIVVFREGTIVGEVPQCFIWYRAVKYDIFPQRSGKHCRILREIAQMIVQGFKVQVFQFVFPDTDCPRFVFQQSGQQL